MGKYDDLLVNDDYDRGFNDGRDDYKDFVLSRFSTFLDEIIDKEVDRLLPQVVYHYSQIQRENTQLWRVCESKDETIEGMELKIDEMMDLLRESKNEIIKRDKQIERLERMVDNG